MGGIFCDVGECLRLKMEGSRFCDDHLVSANALPRPAVVAHPSPSCLHSDYIICGDCLTGPPEPPESIAQEAHRIVLGDRQEAYGHPADDFARTAALWAPILGCEVTAEQVALCLIQVKVSREVHAPKRDNRTDIAGYALTLDLIAQRKETTP